VGREPEESVATERRCERDKSPVDELAEMADEFEFTEMRLLERRRLSIADCERICRELGTKVMAKAGVWVDALFWGPSKVDFGSLGESKASSTIEEPLTGGSGLDMSVKPLVGCSTVVESCCTLRRRALSAELGDI
jgi:hypothetical protein